MKKYAVIVAGGSGSRMKSPVPKQFLTINGKPILFYTVNAFLNAYDDLHVILVLPKENKNPGSLFDSNFASRVTITEGGNTRFDSVKNGLNMISSDDESIVFVHDGVRCMISQELIHRCYDAALIFKTAVPAVMSQDSTRLIDGQNNEVVDRSKVYLIQTPQTFHSSILRQAFDQDYNENFTDEATVVESLGHKIHLVEGDYSNIKITRPFDLKLAELMLSENNQIK
jgi:2-C-methyl-D-erythritol 4-phosphate cytidylyltransferase